MPSIHPTLTPDQEQAVDKFAQFLLSDAKEFYLFGPAGSGKSFLIGYLGEYVYSWKFQNVLKLLAIPYRPYHVIYTATTNKAASVLSEFLGLNVDTIFKRFNIKVTENFLLGTTEVVQKNRPDTTNGVFFIDECSMLSQDALKLIRATCAENNAKLIFIGDNNQLAPVGEKPYWNNTPKDFTATLTTVVRNKNHKSLMDLCEQLKQTVLTGEFKDIQTVKGVIDYVEDEDQLELLKGFRANEDIILSFTNERVDKCMQALKKANPNLCKERHLINANHYVVGYKPGMPEQCGDSFYPEEKVTVMNKMDHHNFFRLVTPKGEVIYADRYRIRSQCIGEQTCYVLPGDDYQRYLKEFAQAKKWTEYFRVKNGAMVLRLPHACTIHKSQGSTFERVFIDLDSFQKCKDKEMLARLLYVAVSRAKDHVYLSGSLPTNCGRILRCN